MLALQRSAGNRATVSLVSAVAPAASRGRVLARTKAEVSMVPGRVLGEHSQGKGGQGGVSHCEQESWKEARAAVEARFKAADATAVRVTFSVDQKICEPCQDWFETVLHPTLARWADANPRNGQSRAFELIVDVGGSTVQVLGAGETAWSAEVGDEARQTPAERLREKVYSMGPDLGGQLGEGDDLVNPAADDRTLLDDRDRIDAAYARWVEFIGDGGTQQTTRRTKGEDVADVLEGVGVGKTSMGGPRPKNERPAVYPPPG